MFKFDSADRTYGSSSNFSLTLKNGVDGLQGDYQIDMVSIPVSWYNVNTYNNVVPLFINGALNLVNIPVGQYDVADLVVSLKAALEAVSGGAVFTVSVHGTTKKLTLSTGRAFELRFGDNTLNSAAGLLGFSSVNVSSVANSITGDCLPNLSPIDTLAINFKGVVDSVSMSNGFNCSVLVPISVQFGSINVSEFEHPAVFSFVNKTRTFDVSIVDARSGKPVDLNGQNWWIVLKKVSA